jgi:hypothetical protein
MKKNYIFILMMIFSLEFTSAQTLSSAPTLTFTSDTNISSDNRATDGDGGSVNISDIDIQIYNISDINGTFTTPLSWQNNNYLFSNNSLYSGITNQNNAGSKGMAIKSVSGSEFKLNQFVYYNWGESSTVTNTIKGFRNGSEVASMTFEGYVSSYIPMTITLTSAFSNVDEVRLYITGGGYLGNQSATNHSINSIKVSSPVLGVNDYEISSKINIYPNPATSQVTIDVKELDNLNLEVSDTNGRKIFEEKLDGSSNTVNINQLSSGIYLFKVNSSQGTATTKVIKK